MRRKEKRLLQVSGLVVAALLFFPNVGLWSLYRDRLFENSAGNTAAGGADSPGGAPVIQVRRSRRRCSPPPRSSSSFLKTRRTQFKYDFVGDYFGCVVYRVSVNAPAPPSPSGHTHTHSVCWFVCVCVSLCDKQTRVDAAVDFCPLTVHSPSTHRGHRGDATSRHVTQIREDQEVVGAVFTDHPSDRLGLTEG